MNFEPELSAFQGAIISADNVHQFSRVTARGGHEDEILDIVTRLFAFLQEKRYITPDGVAEEARRIMRKLTFYVVLNGDFPVLEDLVELPGIDMAIWTIPTIPKCLVCEIIWGLHMEEFLYEAIAMSYPTLSVQVLSPFVDNIKHYSPIDALKKIKLLAAACYRFVCRFNFFIYEEEYLTVTLKDVYELFLRTINYFIAPPNEGRLNNLSEDDAYKYKGNNLRILLSLVLECLGIYTSVEIFDPEGFRDIYLWTLKPENIKTETITHKVCDTPDEKLKECLSNLNMALLDKCKELVMGVSVDIFCAWSEYDEDGKSMQQSIGELCYLLHSKLIKINILGEHPVTEMLPQISCKPVDIHDIIKLADQDTVIENINKDNENRALWLQVVLDKDDVLQQTELIQCLIVNVQHISEEQSIALLKKIIRFVKINHSQENLVVMLGVKILSKFNTTRKHEMINELFEEKTFTNNFETSELDSMMTETFNKLISAPGEDLSQILDVFIQNPYKTYSKVLSCATENIEQCDIMLKIIKMTEQYSSHFYRTDTEPCIIKTIQDFSQDLLSDSQRSNFVHFIVKLKEAGIIPGVKLLLLNIMPNLHRALVSKDVLIVNIQLQLLDIGFTMEELMLYRAPLLAMLAQVMEVVRWSITTFTGAAAEVLDQAIQLQIKFFNSYGDRIPDKDAAWLKGKLRNLSPLNMYYFRKLWNPPGGNYLEIVSAEKNLTTDKLILLLSKILITSTSREWSCVWDSLSSHGDVAALNVIFDSMAIVAAAEKANRSENSWLCVVNCYRNLLVITKEKFFKEPLSDRQVEPVLDKVATIIDLLEEKDVDDLSSAFLSFLSYIFERKRDYTYDVTKFRDKIKHEKFKDMVTQLFSYRNIA